MEIHTIYSRTYLVYSLSSGITGFAFKVILATINSILKFLKIQNLVVNFFQMTPGAKILGLIANKLHSEKARRKLEKVTIGNCQTIIRFGVR